jgi:predicted DNA-binding mobile mystery protein A
MENQTLKRHRHMLDARLAPLKRDGEFLPPPRGWIKAVRQALGMSGVQFAKRLSVRPPTIVALENSERDGTIQLATLRRAAEALDCTLVYALVPKTSLQSNVEERAKHIAHEGIAKATHTMKLEAQSVSTVDAKQQIEEYIWKHVTERDVWNKT